MSVPSTHAPQYSRTRPRRRRGFALSLLAALFLATTPDTSAQGTQTRVAVSAIVRVVACSAQVRVASCVAPNVRLETATPTEAAVAVREDTATRASARSVPVRYLVIEY